MAFKKTTRKVIIPDSIEEMYVDYKNRRIKGPIDHQTDMLRKYTEKHTFQNVALELPTGSGKTLVGLLIAEWRRRKFNEKVLYLCPTKQLVNQVVKQSEEQYGIPVTGFSGPIREFSQDSKTNYRLNKTVSIAPYSALFNTNSFFKEVDTVIFDDAHACDNYLSSPWSIEIGKDDDPALFENIITILKSKVPHSDYVKWQEGYNVGVSDLSWVDMLPGPFFSDVGSDIESAISSYLGHEDNEANQIKYPWSLMSGRLESCSLFYSLNKILIKPLIPPTETLNSFQNNKHRIFMSATLGEGGDLERITGLNQIERIECPEKWKKRAIGRRLFYFPDLYHEDDKYELSVNLVKEAGRALIITSSDKEIKEWKDEHLLEIKDDFKFISARAFEQNAEAFTEEENAVLFLANRYDGVDLVGDECRLLILANLSKGLNLQDKFMLERMLANTNYLDRLKTKMTQMVGRCTRSETDHSLVVVVGTELTDFFNDHRYRKLLHPELQAEVQFGIEQSEVETVEDYIENFKIFLEQGEDWQEADEEIASIRQGVVVNPINGSEILSSISKKEVRIQYELWNKNYTSALDLAKSVLGELEKSELDGYLAFWRYYTGYIFYLVKKQNGEEIGKDVASYFQSASRKATTINWLGRLANQYSKSEIQVEDNTFINRQVDNISRIFTHFGVNHNAKFDIAVGQILEYTAKGNSKQFEQAQCSLGDLLGFKTGKKEADGSPDPWWVLSDKMLVVFEDHSSGEQTGSLGAGKARQAITHKNWIKDNVEIPDNINFTHVLITPKVKFEDGAKSQLKNNACVWDLNDYKKWVTKTIATIREMRTDFRPDDLIIRAKLIDTLQANQLDYAGIEKFLSSKLYKG